MRRNGVRILKYLIGGSLLFAICVLILMSLQTSREIVPSVELDEIPQPFNAHDKGDPTDLIDWHDQEDIVREAGRVGPGEQGTAVDLDPTKVKEKDNLYRVNGFNALASDQISLERSLRDIRHPHCRTKKYQRSLPTVSIIIPFYDEHWTTLLRTFISAMNRAPPGIIKEVILVDDCSTKEFLKGKLDGYLDTNYPKKNVRVLRQAKREGLIRTRLLGARNASGDVLLFLDSHCESNVNWLPPLLDPIARDYRTVVCPFIDVIDHENFFYRAQDEGARGAFDWELYYKRLARIQSSLDRPAEVFDSPVMAGGLFAISSKWFWELGGYDPGLDIWGGEQYELSFKIWQCGGRMVDAPCSRVGHVYRKYSPFPGPVGIGDFVGRNYKRVAEVWMDDWKEHLYRRRPHYRNLETGDLTKQHALRRDLKCRDFDWFMREIAYDLTKTYPAVEPPKFAWGDLRPKVDMSLCVDTKMRGNMESFGLAKCVRDVGGNGEQALEYTFRKDIRPSKRNFCFDVSHKTPLTPVVLFACHGMKGNQHWEYNPNTLQMRHVISGNCLDCNPQSLQIFMQKCDSSSSKQKWNWQNSDRKGLQRIYKV